MNDGRLLDGVLAYYDSIIEEHGPVPQGVGWNGKESQYTKFEQLYKVVLDGHDNFSINELGCGYGAFVDFLGEKGVAARYHGYDISENMYCAAKEYLSGRDDCALYLNEPMRLSDYTVTSGTFNANMGEGQDVVAKDVWEQYILDNLHKMNDASRVGFSFNMQTIYSDFYTKYYYGDPCFYFDYCKKNFSKNVALLHDYELYDFTIIVRKQTTI